MRRRTRGPLPFLVATSLALGAPMGARRALAEERPSGPRYALEVGASGLFAHATGPEDPSAGMWRRRGGAGLAFTIAFRSPYFVTPFLDFSYVPLYASQGVAGAGSPGGSPLVQTSSIAAFGAAFGPAVDFGPFRLKAGVGTNDVVVHSTVSARRIASSELDLGYLVSLSAFALRVSTGRGAHARTFKVGIEGRLGAITEASFTYVTVGAVLTEDVLAW